MSVTHLLSMSREKFELFLTNLHTENKLSDNDISSAALFKTDVSLDLEPLLFLRSTSAKLSLTYFSVDQLALAFTQSENISISLIIPPKILESNVIYNPETIKPINEKEFQLKFTDFTALDMQAPLTYINEMLESHLNLYIIYRLGFAFFDKNIFKKNFFDHASAGNPVKLTSKEIDLILRYIDIQAFVRVILATLLSTEPVEKPLFSLSNLTPPLSHEQEQSVLNQSKILKTISERTTEESEGFFHYVNFEEFYDIDLKSNNENKRNVITKLKNNFVEMFNTILGIDIRSPTPDMKKDILSIINANLAMISQGETLRRILLIQRGKLNLKHPPLSSSSSPLPFFTTELVSLSIDETASKAKFSINNQVFLPPDDTEITIVFPKKASHTLGASPLEKNVQIGPITHNTDTVSYKTPQLSHVIYSEMQRLFCGIRHHPKIVHVSTNVLSASDNRNPWPINDEFPDFQTIYSHPVDDTTFEQRFIHKNSSDLNFCRMLRTHNSLQQIKLLMTDECGHILFFPRNTYVFASVRLEPFSKD